MKYLVETTITKTNGDFVRSSSHIVESDKTALEVFRSQIYATARMQLGKRKTKFTIMVAPLKDLHEFDSSSSMDQSIYDHILAKAKKDETEQRERMKNFKIDGPIKLED